MFYFFRDISGAFMDRFVALMEIVWIDNVVPLEWKSTLQVPIPKVPRPTGVGQYRRITLCNTGYKIYSKFLLKVICLLFQFPLPYLTLSFLSYFLVSFSIGT